MTGQRQDNSARHCSTPRGHLRGTQQSLVHSCSPFSLGRRDEGSLLGGWRVFLDRGTLVYSWVYLSIFCSLWLFAFWRSFPFHCSLWLHLKEVSRNQNYKLAFCPWKTGCLWVILQLKQLAFFFICW